MLDRAVILVAEDEEDYVLLIKRAFAQANYPNPIYVVPDGQEALAYLKGEGHYASRLEYPLPDLLIVDLKLPRYNGFEILRWVRKQPELSGLRVLVLTSSDAIRDVNEAYQLGANSFLVKPYDFSDLVGLTKLIQDFWLKASKSPESRRPPGSVGNRDEPNGSKKGCPS